jgi:hypothetical protein
MSKLITSLGILISIVHGVTVYFYSFYAFFIPKNFLYDYLYFVSLIIIQLLWIFFKHECPFSYFYKKLHYKNYKCGDTTTIDDAYIWMESSENHPHSNDFGYNEIMVNILLLFYLASIIIVSYRSKIANVYLTVFFFIIIRQCYFVLNNAVVFNLRKYLDDSKYKSVKKLYYIYKIDQIKDAINSAIFISMIWFFIYITYKNRTRLYGKFYE